MGGGTGDVGVFFKLGRGLKAQLQKNSTQNMETKNKKTSLFAVRGRMDGEGRSPNAGKHKGAGVSALARLALGRLPLLVV